ncbi:MAG: NADH:ubiquinone oxidoreductase subunit 4 (chain M), partial [Candidatus Methanomarinus sp.]
MNIYLSLILFLPLIGAALTFFIKPREIARVVALVFSVIPLFITALLLTTFESGSGFHFVENYTWI